MLSWLSAQQGRSGSRLTTRAFDDLHVDGCSHVRREPDLLHVYAEAGLREYWIINLVDRTVEVRTEPRPSEGKIRGTYAVLHEYRGDEKVPLRLNGQTIAEFPVTELIPL